MNPREIKFRVWSPSENKFLPQYMGQSEHYSFGGISGPLKVHAECHGEFIYYVEDAIIQQFTGLHDSAGKEIFEGDIVNFHDYQSKKIRSGKVEWFQHSWVINEKNMWGLNFDSFPISQIVVLGNIYENPELLKNES